MASPADPLTAIASPPPTFSAGEIGELVDQQYGLRGDLDELVSERDQNFRLTTADQSRYVVKIANAAESATITDFQVCALQHLERKGCPVAVPRIISTVGGAAMTRIPDADTGHALRIVSYVAGVPLEGIKPNAELARQLGSCLANIGAALRGFKHPGDSQALLWDMRRAGDLRTLLSHVSDARLRGEISDCLDDYAAHAAPKLGELRSQVIHNDLNPGNVLVTATKPAAIAGVIDFGDMIRAPLIIDVAVAAAYLRSDADDALELLLPFVGGYHAVAPLDGSELELLYDLVRARLATTLTILHWRMSARGENDPYTADSLVGGASAIRFLNAINALSRGEFDARLRASCEN